MDHPPQTMMVQPSQAEQPQHCKSNTKVCKSKSDPSYELPLTQIIQDNFSASRFANLYTLPNNNSSNNTNSKTNDTTTTADSTAASSSFDKEKSGEFASFLASREFDASAIITGDDGEECRESCVQEVNVSIFSAIGDELQMDAATAVVTPDQKSPVYSNPVDDFIEPATSAKGTSNYVKKNLVTVPDIDSSERNEGAEQSWWPLPSSIQAIWEQITATDHCNCLAGTMWNTDESDTKEIQPCSTNRAVVNHETAQTINVISPAPSLDKSTSFVIPSQNKEPVTPRTPLQRKLASTPVNYHPTSSSNNNYVSPMRIDYLEGPTSSSQPFTFSSSKPSHPRPYVTTNASELSCRSVVTPLIGEHLVSTPLHGDNPHYFYENSIMSNNTSKASSSHLFGEDISKHDASCSLVEDLFDSTQRKNRNGVKYSSAYSPPPAHLLPQAKIQKEMVFATSVDCKTMGFVNTDRSNKYLKRVKDRRRMKRNDS
jgi:hypothetical protein